MIEVREITVNDAFQYHRKKPSNSKPERTAHCHICAKDINRIYVVNDRFGICSCGNIIFDWRPIDKKGRELSKEDQQALRKALNFVVLKDEMNWDVGIPLRFTKDTETIEETIEALKLIKKMRQEKTVRSLTGFTNKFKYYLLGYVLEDIEFKRG